MKKIDLGEYGLKKTGPRQAVLSVLCKAKLPLSAEAIYGKLGSSGENLSTVYRALSSFEKAGIIKKEIDETGENTYFLNGGRDTHVIVCVECHKKMYLDDCPYEDANVAIAKKTGFRVFDHNVQLYGLCPDCQKKAHK